jgi:integrase/recombinase XerD
LSTVCGFYRFAHIDGRVASNPAQYVRRPKVYPTEGHGMDRGELGRFLFTAEGFDRNHADPRTTTIYDRRRDNFDRHAA